MVVRDWSTAIRGPDPELDAEPDAEPDAESGDESIEGPAIGAILPSRRRARFPGMRIPTVRLSFGAAGGRSLTLPMAAFLLVLASGCNKKDGGPRPAGITANSGTVTSTPTGSPVAPTTGVSPAPGAGAGGTIVGKILLDPARKGDVTPNDVVYLVARRIPDNPGARGSLVAVKRYTAGSFPIEFTLGAADMMFKNGAFEGDLTLAARVDKDGDPMTRRKGDVFGTVDRVKVGAAPVEIKLDQLQKEDESLAGGAPPAGGMPSGHP
jgi:hypothetical protein